jgi:hypothetical protein
MAPQVPNQPLTHALASSFLADLFRGWRPEQIMSVTIVLYSIMDWGAPFAWMLLRMWIVLSEISAVLRKYGANPERLRRWTQECVVDMGVMVLLLLHTGSTIGMLL